MITVIGSLNYDLVTYTDKVPEGGETFHANSFENHHGGKGLNEALAVARLRSSDSTTVQMVGKVGDDSFGKELRETLEIANVDTTHVKTVEGISSGVAVILVETDGENRILITSGANGELKPTADEYQEIFRNSKPGEFVVLQNEYPDTVKLVEWLRENKPDINIAYNPSPYRPELGTTEFLKKIDLLIVNEGEALDIAASLLLATTLADFKKEIRENKVNGFQSLATKIRALLNPNNINTVIITMGSKGSVHCSKEQEGKFTESRKINTVVDTTGAGDTFFGGVVVRLSEGASLAQAVDFATAASALAIQKKGAAESIPFYREVN